MKELGIALITSGALAAVANGTSTFGGMTPARAIITWVFILTFAAAASYAVLEE